MFFRTVVHWLGVVRGCSAGTVSLRRRKNLASAQRVAEEWSDPSGRCTGRQPPWL